MTSNTPSSAGPDEKELGESKKSQSQKTAAGLGRCPYCRKTPRSKLAKRSAERYAPYCSFHCQEWGNLYRAHAYIEGLKANTEQGGRKK